MNFPSRIYFGQNALITHGEKLLTEMNNGAVLVFVSRSISSHKNVQSFIKLIKKKKRVIIKHCHSEPTLKDLINLKNDYRKMQTAAIVGIGGGSVIDLAKAAAVEIFGHKRNDIYVLAVPTTAGSGSEVTNISILLDSQKKTALIDDRLIPNMVILDPELLISLPTKVRVFSIIDATSHAIESLWGGKKNFVSSFFAISALQEIIELNKKYITSRDLEIINSVQFAAMNSGIAFSEAGTNIVHAFAYGLIEQIPLPHGQSVAISLSPILRFLLMNKEVEVPSLVLHKSLINSIVKMSATYDKIVYKVAYKTLNIEHWISAVFGHSRLIENFPAKLLESEAIEIAKKIDEKLKFYSCKGSR